jgi:hypothetical protein
LTALASRFSSTCPSFSWSAQTRSRRVGKRDVEREPLGRELRRDERHDVPDDVGDRHLAHVERDAPFLEPGEVEHVGHEREQVRLRPRDPAEHLALRVRERPVEAVVEEADVAPDRVERRAQLVTHAREEVGPRPVRALGLGPVSVRVGALPLRVGVRRLRPRLRRLRRVGALLQLGRDALQRLVGRLELGRLLLQLQGGRLGLQTRRVLGRREPRRLDRGPRALGHVARERHLGVGPRRAGAAVSSSRAATHRPPRRSGRCT